MEEVLKEINKKLDILMKHVGCETAEKKYMSMSEEDKDSYDEKELNDKKEK